MHRCSLLPLLRRREDARRIRTSRDGRAVRAVAESAGAAGGGETGREGACLKERERARNEAVLAEVRPRPGVRACLRCGAAASCGDPGGPE